GDDLLDVFLVPLEGDLLALLFRVQLLERVAADEVVVELHERAVTQLPRVEVVVLDLLTDERTADRTGGFVGVGRQPLAVALQLVAGVARRQRARDPAGFERVRRIGTRTDRDQAELFACLEDLLADVVLVLVGAPDFQTRRTGHAVAQRADGLVADLHRAHVEELELVERLAVELLDHVPGARALDLEAPGDALHRLAHRAARRTVVMDDLDVVAAGLTVVAQPVGGRSAADVNELFFLEPEDDAVADDVAVRRGRHVLLRLVDGPALRRVDHRVAEQLQRIGTLDVKVDHVVRLIEQHGAVLPSPLLGAPVGEFRRDHGVNVRADLRVPQLLDDVRGVLQDLF